MIGLIALAGIAVWLAAVIYLCKRMPHWLGITRFAKAVQFLLFPVLLVLPIADELIGHWQFKRLCEHESVIHLSDDWRKVKRAKNVSSDHSEKLRWYVTRIHERELKYQDVDTKEIFLKYKSFRNYGGFLMDKAGLRLSGEPPSCWPINEHQVRKEINLQQLLDEGEGK